MFVQVISWNFGSYRINRLLMMDKAHFHLPWTSIRITFIMGHKKIPTSSVNDLWIIESCLHGAVWCPLARARHHSNCNITPLYRHQNLGCVALSSKTWSISKVGQWVTLHKTCWMFCSKCNFMECRYSVACNISWFVCLWLLPLAHLKSKLCVSLHMTIIKLEQNISKQIVAITVQKMHDVLC